MLAGTTHLLSTVPPDGRGDPVALHRQIEPSFGGHLFAPLGHQRYLRRQHLPGDIQHFFFTGQFQIQLDGRSLPQQPQVTLLNMPAVLAQVASDAVGPRLLAELRRRDKGVAVVAVDPASPITGGSLLGDRARMTLAAGDEGVFLRSAASRGEMGGLAPTTGTMVEVLTSDKGSWTILTTLPNGLSCMVAAGKYWENLPKKVAGIEM